MIVIRRLIIMNWPESALAYTAWGIHRFEPPPVFAPQVPIGISWVTHILPRSFPNTKRTHQIDECALFEKVFQMIGVSCFGPFSYLSKLMIYYMLYEIKCYLWFFYKLLYVLGKFFQCSELDVVYVPGSASDSVRSFCHGSMIQIVYLDKSGIVIVP